MNELQALRSITKDIFGSYDDVIKLLSDEVVIGKVAKLRYVDTILNIYAYNIELFRTNYFNFRTGINKDRAVLRNSTLSCILLSISIMSNAGISFDSIKYSIKKITEEPIQPTIADIEEMTTKVITEYILNKLENREISKYYYEMMNCFKILLNLIFKYNDIIEAVKLLQIERLDINEK